MTAPVGTGVLPLFSTTTASAQGSLLESKYCSNSGSCEVSARRVDSRSALRLLLTEISSARMEIAISFGVSAPMESPIGV